MPYVLRNKDGDIVSLRQAPDETSKEYLPPTHKDIVDFLTKDNGEEVTKDALSESDQDFMRATEDLIHLLIEKNIILFTELPPAVQAKMAGREKLRSHLSNESYSFLDDGESI